MVTHRISVVPPYIGELLKVRGESAWTSPCVLVEKEDGTMRFCTDYRKINAVTKAASYPIPRIEDCIDRICRARFITKCDQLKGYWAIPLTEKAKEIPAFLVPNGAYQYKVMPFGMRNSQATFKRMVSKCLEGLSGVDANGDDIIEFSETRKEPLLTYPFTGLSPS